MKLDDVKIDIKSITRKYPSGEIMKLNARDRYEIIYILYASGQGGIRDIADSLGINTQTVRRAIKEIGEKEFDYIPDALKAVAIERVDEKIQMLNEELKKARSMPLQTSRFYAITTLVNTIRKEEEFKLTLVNAMRGSIDAPKMNLNIITNIPREGSTDKDNRVVNVTPGGKHITAGTNNE